MSARARVIDCLARQARRFPDLEIGPLDITGLSPRDAALARAIEHAVAKRWLTLAAVIDHVLDQDWAALQGDVQAPLLAGAAQLLLFDKLPDHAILNDAVEWSKASARPKAAGLVNAVLRRIAALRLARVPAHNPAALDELPLADGRAWKLAAPVFAGDNVERLARTTSHPTELIRQWAGRDGLESTRRLALHDIVDPPLIVAGLPDDVAAATPGLTPHEQPGFHVFAGDHNELSALLGAHPSARVQDPAAAEPIAATATMNPSTIIDYCAGMGTKTAQLLALHPRARIIATDRSPRRLAALRAAFAGRDRMEVVEFASIREHAGRADLLVLDVPCSNSGVLARRVEARYRLTGEAIERLAGIQRQIVADCLPLLAPDGRILYATCSIEPEENERLVEWICHWHPYRTRLAAARRPRGAPGEPASGYRDGGYYALLEPAS